MKETPDNVEELVAEVRKVIAENRQFLEKLADEAIEVDSDDNPDITADEGDFEEL